MIPGSRLFFRQFKIGAQRLLNRCPHWLRVLAGPLSGGIIGLIGGIPGFFIGLLLGYLLREILVQSVRDRRILEYLEYPGRRFFEDEPGMAAWCALAVLVASASEGTSRVSPESLSGERILKQVVIEASRIFTGPRADPVLMEHFSRLALSRSESLNPDLLAESLAARRAASEKSDKMEDLANLCRVLTGLAEGERAKNLARDIRRILNPASEASGTAPADPRDADPWKILGLSPLTPKREIKAHYRRLAKLFHPDELAVLDEKRRETAASAFMAIKDAYVKIMDA